MNQKNRTCDELGVCQGLSPVQCPDCDSFECEVACALKPARRTYPFAPGVIQGPRDHAWAGLIDPTPQPLARDTLVLLVLVLLMALVGTLIGGMLAGYLHAPAWLFAGLPG